MCPECMEALIILESQGIELDHCIICLGTWIDACELKKLSEIFALPAGKLSGLVQPGSRKPPLRDSKPGGRKCPRCRRGLRPEIIDGAEPLEIDLCPAGHGLWFDRGEIRRFVAGFSGGEEGRIAQLFTDFLKSELTVEKTV